nr:Gag-Pol polyprotein [Tanacetum cinerariifolium]
MVAEDDEMSKDKEIDKPMALISLSFKKIYKPTNNNLQTSSNTGRANQNNSPRINRGAGFDNQRLGNVVRAKETVEQADWRDDTNDESEDQELEAHYMYMAKIQDISPDAVDSGPISDFEPKFLGTVKFGNDQIAPILGYGDLNDIVVGLPKLKFINDYLCSSCELGKAKRKSFHTKTTLSSKRWLQLLHMDLCGPMRVASINGKKYVLVIVDDYSRYTLTHFLRSKDKTPEVLIDFLRLVQRGLHAQLRIVRTDKGTEFLNKTLYAYFASEGIHHQTRQLESDGEMCMFALTVSQTKPKNIKEAMADSARIESMQEELHQFDRLDV